MGSLFDFNGAFEKDLVDYRNDITPRCVKISAKIKFESKMKREAVEALITELPGEDEALLITSNGSFDYFTIIPQVINLSGCKCKNFYFSTWTMSRENVAQILDMYDRGLFGSVSAITGEYFRTRESQVYSMLHEGLKERGQRLVAHKNHSKITLMEMEDGNFYDIRGSANFTANPRIEQFDLFNSKAAFDGDKDWMEGVFKKYKA